MPQEIKNFVIEYKPRNVEYSSQQGRGKLFFPANSEEDAVNRFYREFYPNGDLIALTVGQYNTLYRY